MNFTKILPILVIVIALVWFIFAQKSPQITTADTQPTTPSTSLPGLQIGTTWDSGQSQLLKRLSAINLPALKQEGNVLHTHQHLDININGKLISLPDQIGQASDQSFISPVHTHDKSGIIHVESPEVRDFTLGQFFDVWGVVLTDNCVGIYCQNNGNILRLFSNGSPVNFNFRELKLIPKQKIYLYYGPASSLPETIPSAYQFPPGY